MPLLPPAAPCGEGAISRDLGVIVWNPHTFNSLYRVTLPPVEKPTEP